MFQSFTVYGLALDIVGVLFLGLAIAAPKDTTLGEYATMRMSDIQSILRPMVAQRLDARIGLPILSLGFFFQFLSALGCSIPKEAEGAVWSWTILLVIFLLLIRGGLVQYDYERVKESTELKLEEEKKQQRKG